MATGKPHPPLTEHQRRTLAEIRIVEAMERGEFDNLPGMGKPLDLEPPPPGHEDMWWAMRLLKNAKIVTDEVRYRKQIDELRAQLASATQEAEVRRIVRELNVWIVKLNTMGTNAIPTTLAPFDEESEVGRRCGK